MIKGGSGFDMARADYTFLSYVYAGGTGLLIVFCGLLLNRVNWFGKEFITKCGMYSYWILIIHTIDYLAVPWWDLWSENPYPILASVIELGLRILIITLGCEIIKKVTKLRYKKNRNFDSKITHKVSC